MKFDVILSVCIPTYNRIDLLRGLFLSLGDSSYVEFVVIDDGSTENICELIGEFSHVHNIIYNYQENMGRAGALRNAFSRANGLYIMIMDSDDLFVASEFGRLCQFLCVEVKNIQSDEKLECYVSGQYINDRALKLPMGLCSNYIKIRADEKVKGDLREIIPTKILKKVSDSIDWNCRRIPTYLIWAKIAELHDCKTLDMLPTIKQYLADGITQNIYKMKIEDSRPMRELYMGLALSKRYDSFQYRLRSRFLSGRYAFHSGKKEAFLDEGWAQFFGYILGYIEKNFGRARHIK